MIRYPEEIINSFTILLCLLLLRLELEHGSVHYVDSVINALYAET